MGRRIKGMLAPQPEFVGGSPHRFVPAITAVPAGKPSAE